MVSLAVAMLADGNSFDRVERMLDTILAEPEVRTAIQAEKCLACPPGCRTCSTDESDCECYEHQNDHPGSKEEL